MSSARAGSAADSADEARPLLTTARTTATTRTLSNYERLACCYDAWASWERPYVEAGFIFFIFILAIVLLLFQ